MLDTLFDILKENNFAQGGLVIAVFTSILFYLKKVPGLITSVFQRRCTSYISLDHDQEPLKWMLVWLSQTSYGKKTKHLTVRDTEGRLTVGSGNHYFFRGRSLVIVKYVREHILRDGVPLGLKESLSLRTVPGSRKIIENLLVEAKEVYTEEREHLTSILMAAPWGDCWRSFATIQKPSLDSVILPSEQMSIVYDRLRRFLNNRDVCLKHGIPWRMGFLLYGPPGNGKTSLAKAIAGHMGYSLYILSLNGLSSDKQLLTLCSEIPDKSILLIEDIDTYNVKRDQNSEKSISLSGLLNALDGVTARDGRITIMTTNHPDELDKALIRKGRADVHMELKAPVEEQLVKLFARFGYDYNGEVFENMAAAQDHLLNICEYRFALSDTLNSHNPVSRQ